MSGWGEGLRREEKMSPEGNKTPGWREEAGTKPVATVWCHSRGGSVQSTVDRQQEDGDRTSCHTYFPRLEHMEKQKDTNSWRQRQIFSPFGGPVWQPGAPEGAQGQTAAKKYRWGQPRAWQSPLTPLQMLSLAQRNPFPSLHLTFCFHERPSCSESRFSPITAHLWKPFFWVHLP